MQDTDAACRQAVQILRNGGVVAHPTDTVWGLAADAANPAAVAKVHAIKQSDSSKQLLQIVPTIDYAAKIAELSPDAERLIAAFWPGGLALVLPMKSSPPLNSPPQGGEGISIGLRHPDHDLSLRLAHELGRPIISTSANITGQPTPTTAADIQKTFAEHDAQPDLILDIVATTASAGEPSTILDLSGSAPRLLRSGAVPVTAIETVLGRPLR